MTGAALPGAFPIRQRFLQEVRFSSASNGRQTAGLPMFLAALFHNGALWVSAGSPTARHERFQLYQRWFC